MKLFSSLLLLATIAFCSQAKAASAKELFMSNCASCHGSDGKAQTPIGKKLGVKNLAESKFQTNDIKNRITLGAKNAKGELKMPPFEQKLSKPEIADLAAYVKSLQH